MTDTVQYHLYRGVIIPDPDNTYIEDNVSIGRNSIIEPFTTIYSGCIIGENCTIKSFCRISSTTIGHNCTINSSQLSDCVIGNDTTVGPNATIRQDTVIGNNCRIGNFVEIKHSTVGNFTKSAHLSYIGDCNIGNNCNIGCGVVFANYDGKLKHLSNVGNNCFIGCNSVIISPCNIEDNCYIASSSVLTTNLEKYDFAIGRCPIVVKHNYSQKYIP